jgi:putative cardiolipin synthase
LLLDDLNIGQYQDPLLILDAHPNIEIRMFNPFAHRYWRALDVFRFSEVNRRMHNKSLNADNQTVIIGGRNIGKEYFTASQEENFGDYDVWCFGPVVNESSQSFDLYWNDRLAIPLKVLYQRKVEEGELPAFREELAAVAKGVEESPYQKTLDETELTRAFKAGKLKSYWGKAKVFSDSPAKIRGEENPKNKPVLNQVTALPIKSSKEIFIVSPYFIPGKNGVGYFSKKIQSGVRVDVFTNSLASNDVGLVFAGYKKYRKDLIRAGVGLYEMKPKAHVDKKKSSMGVTSGARLGLHGKIYIFDRRVMFVGSMNLDPRSVDLNSELGVLFESPELADKFVTNMLTELPDIAYKVSLTDKEKLKWTTKENGEEVVLDREPEASGWKSFKSGFLSLFIPESLL